jgi:two-component sensor histidine kinase
VIFWERFRRISGKLPPKGSATILRNVVHRLGGLRCEVVRTEMNPYEDRVSIEGPSLMLTSQAAENFALALHELATNAAKYGALSNTTGRVHISWSVFKPNGYRQFIFPWQENSREVAGIVARIGQLACVLVGRVADHQCHSFGRSSLSIPLLPTEGPAVPA